MPKSLLTLSVIVTMLIAHGQVFGYALIDLDPRTKALNLVAEEAQGAASEEPLDEVAAVEVTHKQKGHLLALVPVNFTVRVIARADGSLEVEYPWYAFMTLSGREELETRLRVAADSARRSASVGSVKTAGESADPKFTAEEAEAVREKLTLVLAEHGRQ